MSQVVSGQSGPCVPSKQLRARLEAALKSKADEAHEWQADGGAATGAAAGAPHNDNKCSTALANTIAYKDVPNVYDGRRSSRAFCGNAQLMEPAVQAGVVFICFMVLLLCCCLTLPNCCRCGGVRRG